MIFKINFERGTVNAWKWTMKAAALSVDFVGAENSTENPKTLDVCTTRELFRALPPSIRCNWCIDLLRVWMQLKSSVAHTSGVSHSYGAISLQINRLPWQHEWAHVGYDRFILNIASTFLDANLATCQPSTASRWNASKAFVIFPAHQHHKRRGGRLVDAGWKRLELIPASAKI